MHGTDRQRGDWAAPPDQNHLNRTTWTTPEWHLNNIIWTTPEHHHLNNTWTAPPEQQYLHSTHPAEGPLPLSTAGISQQGLSSEHSRAGALTCSLTLSTAHLSQHLLWRHCQVQSYLMAEKQQNICLLMPAGSGLHSKPPLCLIITENQTPIFISDLWSLITAFLVLKKPQSSFKKQFVGNSDIRVLRLDQQCFQDVVLLCKQ